MKNPESKQQLLQAMVNFNAAYETLLNAIEEYEQKNETSVNDLHGFTESYPFDKSFDELAIGQWVADTIEGSTSCNFKVLNYQYLNTGGNCMVGIHEVWLPEEKKVVYVYTNEEGGTISTVDYIRLDIDVDDYDELIMDYADWGRITGYEKYFELYRHCHSQYLVDDCRHFCITRGVPYHFLSEELQEKLTSDYLKYCEDEHGGLIDTNGRSIIVYPDYVAPTDSDKQLEAIKEFRRWHDTIAGVEEYYLEEYTLTFAGHTVKLPFYAEVWDAIDSLLERTIQDW
jgi:hypothetical protein